MAIETTMTAPWDAQQPYLQNVFANAQSLYQRGTPAYGGKMVADMSPQTLQALQQYQAMAGQGNGQASALNSMMTGTLRGDYLNSNPYMDAMYDNAARAVTRNYREAVAPGIGAQFDSAGRYGSGMYQNAMDSSRDTLASNLSGMASTLYGQNYANERDQQMKAAALTPSTMPMNYYDASQLLNVGKAYDQKQQEQLTADYNKWAYSQSAPWNALANYAGAVGGGYGSVNTAPLYSNSTAQNIGLGLTAASVLPSAVQGLQNLGNWIFN